MDANDALKELTDVKPGDDVADVASSKRINAIQTTLRWLVAGGNITTGPGMRKRTGTGWVTLTSDARGGRGGGAAGEYPFQLIGLVEAASEEDDTPTAKVRVVDGRINGEFPDGMGFDPDLPYKLTIENDTTILALVTFDASTLAITSRSLYAEDEPPPSFIDTISTSSGSLYFHIGWAQIEYNAESQPAKVWVQNNLADNIHFELVFGAVNGVPALLPLATHGIGWISIPSGP